MGVISDKIRDFKYGNEVDRAVKLQHETAYYVERGESQYQQGFTNRVKEIYNKDMYKLRRFNQAFKGETLPSIDISETIFNELFRVFEGQNKYINRTFTYDDLIQDANIFFSKNNQFYRTELWNAIKTKFCSFVVVDLPQIQSTPRPEPYPFILNISNVRYLSLNGTEPNEIIFTEKVTTDKGLEVLYYWYTDKTYSIWKIGTFDELIYESPHDLGYCPAKFVKNSFLNSDSKILRSNNVTSSLEDMFWFVFKTIESRKADLLYLNPDKQAPKNSCGWENKNEKCFGGKLVDKNKQPVIDSDGFTHKNCPICGDKQYNSGGAGNLISIDYEATAIAEGKVDPTSPLIQYIQPPIEGIEVQYTRINELKDYIIKSCVGAESTQTKEAINEKQQIASFESKEQILKNLSVDISQTIEWIEKTQCKLRYGSSFVKNSYYLGDKWYLQTIDDLIARKEKNTNPIEKEQIELQIIETKYNSNPEKLEREKLIYKLLPYRTLTDSDFLDMVKSGTMDEDSKLLRLDFSNIINMFELDYGDISIFYNRFSDTITGTKRISIIKDILKLYYNINKIKENVQNQIS